MPGRLELTDLPKYSVRVRAEAKSGTGFFVGPTLVLTCAHVLIIDGSNRTCQKPTIEIPAGDSMTSYPAVVRELLSDTILGGVTAEEEGFAFPDIALLEVSCPAHDYVSIARSAAGAKFAYYGFTGNTPYAETTFLEAEGFRDFGNRRLVKFAGGQVRPGHSGAAILDRDTGQICGMLNWTRNRKLSLGGFAVPGGTILECVKAVVASGETTDEPVHRQYIPALSTPFFTGRDKELSDLAGELDRHGAVLLHGMAGAGKSELALQYCAREGRKYNSIIWATANSRDRLTADLVAALRQMSNEAGPIDDRAVASELLRRAREYGTWLLVIDDVKDVEVIKVLTPFLGGGKVIATSVRTEMRAAGIHAGIPVIELEHGDAQSFLLKRCRAAERNSGVLLEAEREAAGQLASHLGCLPLALEVAGGYIEAIEVSIGAYLEQYKKLGPQLLDRAQPQYGTEVPPSVAQACAIAFDRLSASGKQFFEHISVLGAAAIPLAFLQKWMYSTKGKEDADAAFKVREIVFEIGSVSLGRKHREPFGDFLVVNGLVQEIARTRMAADRRTKVTEAVCMPLAVYANDLELLPPLVPHILELADRLKRDPVSPKVELAFRSTASTPLLRKSLYSLGLSVFGDSVQLAKSFGGPQSQIYVMTLAQFADLSFEAADYAGAEAAADEARRVIEPYLRDPDPQSRQTAVRLFARATWFSAMIRRHTNTRVAADLVTDGIRKLTAAGAGNDELRELRLVLPQILRSTAAPEAILWAIEKQRELVNSYGTDPQYTRDRAAALATLGEFYQNVDEYAAAAIALDEALRIQVKVLGEHVETAETMFRLGSVFLNEPSTAEQGHRMMAKGLSVLEKLLGPHHPRTIYLRAIIDKTGT
jgi:Trypsin-like peptidase domain/NB-ARC domain